MKQAKKLKIKVVLPILIIFLGLLIGGIFYFRNKISADQQQAAQAIEASDVKTTTLVAESDQRTEVAVQILMYHHIRIYNDPNDKIGTNLSVPPENFTAQIKYLKDNGYTTITFTDLLGFPAKKLPDKPIILTFDDGYIDAYDNAYLKLKQNNQVGVFYIISGFIGRPEQLTSNQIKEMSDKGMEIGSHTVNHPDLTKINPTKLNQELVNSKTALELIIGKPVLSFCFPSGQHNVAIDSAVINAGYSSATTTYMAISSTSENKIGLSRLRVNPTDSLSYFSDKILNYKHK